MYIFIYKLVIGLVISSIISFFGYLLKLLTPSGARISALIGAFVIASGPWYSILLMGLFFASTGAIQLIKKYFNKSESIISEKGGQRDRAQVIANSLPALFSLLFFALTKDNLYLLGYVAVLSGATADTWASEIGVLSRKVPRSILTGRKMLAGQSGGVSWLGSGAAFLGSILISSTFYLFLFFDQNFSLPPLCCWLIPMIAGFATSHIDSLLGATVQASYRCLVCGRLTEKEVHHQQPTRLVKGYQFFNNDMVNFLSGILTLMVTVLLASIFA